jgi:hypothetical protein
MKSSVFCVLLVVGLGFASFSQTVSTDSLDIPSDSIRINPDRRNVAIPSLGVYAYSTPDLIGLQTYAGFSIVNALRGHVPNLSIGANASEVSGSLRNNESMLVIDGIPYSGAMSSFYNLNSFEYKSVGVVSSGNGLALYGGAGSNGTIFLENKNGEGIEGPQFELNSFSTFSRIDEWNVGWAGIEKVDQWMFTNSLAYSQDYGMADLRISYSNSFLPAASGHFNTKIDRNSLRLNAGFKITPRFSARLIGDTRYSVSNSNDDYTDFGNDQRNLHANLFLKYEALDWLTLTSQSVLAEVNRNSESEGDYYYTFDDDQSRRLINLFATASPFISTESSITFMTGAQVERHRMFMEGNFVSGSSASRNTLDAAGKTISWFGQLNTSLHKVLFADLNYRLDYFKDAPDDLKTQPTYSFNVAADFGNAFHWKNNWFTSGKIRGSVGKTNALEATGFPYSSSELSPRFLPGIGQVGIGQVIGNPDLEPTKRKLIELGADFNLIHSRIIFNTTYFNTLNNQTLVRVSLPGPSGYYETTVDIGEMRMEGWEFALAAIPWQKANTSLLTKLIYATYYSGINPKENSGFELTSLDSTVPEWTGSFLSQLKVKNTFVLILINHQKGGTYTLWDPWIGPVGDLDFTQTWLRDFSVGYNFSRVSLSLSGRNIWKIYGASETIERIQKTVSASVTVRI